MDNKTRAEKIAYLFRDEFDVPSYLLPKIEAIFDEAVREAEIKAMRLFAEQSQSYANEGAYDLGFAAARDKAMNLAVQCEPPWDRHDHQICQQIAEAIRAMQPDGKEGA